MNERPPFALVVLQGDPAHLGQIFRLEEGSYLIGRSDEADIQLAEITLSRRHARITIREGQAILQDSESASGTEVDGERIGSHITLKPNAKIRMGQVVMKLITDPDAPQEALAGCPRTIYDGLTKTLNLAAFREAMDSALPGQCSLIVTDIDRFAYLNYEHGHTVGDEVLYEMAQRIQEVVGSIAQGKLGRVAGDSFGILLPGMDRDAAGEVAKRVVECVAERDFCVNGIQLEVYISAAVMECSGAMISQTIKERINEAMEGIYRAKELGGNRVELL